MKLITQKCPNCGASLSFEEEDKKVTCEYCKQKILIEREKENKNYYDSEDFKLRIEKAQARDKKVLIIVIVIVIMVFALIIFTATRIFKSFDKTIKEDIPSFTESLKPKDKYVKSISEINEESLSLLKEESLKALNEWTTYFEKTSDWHYVGLYLLTKKSGSGNKLYMVYKKSYKIDKKDVEKYGTVYYNNIQLLENDKIYYSMEGFVEAPMQGFGDNHVTVFGYDSNRDLYNEEIRLNIKDYTVTSTDGMYMEE